MLTDGIGSGDAGVEGGELGTVALGEGEQVTVGRFLGGLHVGRQRIGPEVICKACETAGCHHGPKQGLGLGNAGAKLGVKRHAHKTQLGDRASRQLRGGRPGNQPLFRLGVVGMRRVRQSHQHVDFEKAGHSDSVSAAFSISRDIGFFPGASGLIGRPVTGLIEKP